MAKKTPNDVTDVTTWNFDFLVSECIRRLSTALFTGGGEAMRTEMVLCINIIGQWQANNAKQVRGT